MYVVNRKRFRYAVRTVRNAVLIAVAVVWFLVFVYRHSGLGVEVDAVACKGYEEYVTYEYVTEGCEGNQRLKETRPVKVVYRWYE